MHGGAGECGLDGRIFIEHRDAAKPKLRLHLLRQNAAEDIRPAFARAEGHRRDSRKRLRVGRAISPQRGKQVHPGMNLEGFVDGQPFSLGEGIGLPAPPAELPRSGRFRSQLHKRQRIGDNGLVILPHPVPLQHGEFGRVRQRPLAVPPHVPEVEDALFARRQQLLGCKFRRCVQVAPLD